jgi:hypothetical protein
MMQPGVAVTVPLFRRGVLGRGACVVVLGDPVLDRLVGVTDAAPAAPDELGPVAVLSVPLQCPRREMEKARGVVFEMYQHLKGLSCSCRLLPIDDSRSVVSGDFNFSNIMLLQIVK